MADMNAYQKLEKIFEKLAHLKHLQVIAAWDEAVMMPQGGGDARAQALSTLQSMMHEILTKPEVGELIADAKQLTLEPVWETANLRWMERAHLNATALPNDLVKALTESRIQSEQAWRVYRAENRWHDFQPLLEKTINLSRESATIRAAIFKKSPYDVLLDDFMPGMTQTEIDPLFSELKIVLPPLVSTIIDKQRSDSIVPLPTHFPIEKQKKLSIALMQALAFDFQHGRLDESHHPFCGGDPQDVRLTTRYNERNVMSGIMGVCHETGHARYEQGLPSAWLRQPVGRAHHMAIHESQSLIVEMQACRSPEFMQFLSPLLIQHFGNEPAFHPANLQKHYTRVQRSAIRVDADAVTYPLHVILRYELEQALIANTLSIADLADAWNARMQTYLQLSMQGNYKDSVMQDVHWGAGLFGYFPAYTLGSLMAAQLFAAVKRAHPDLMPALSRGDFTQLFSWLNQHIHQRASAVDYLTLLKDATGHPLTITPFIEHIQSRYQNAI